jgi:hypothetical protein
MFQAHTAQEHLATTDVGGTMQTTYLETEQTTSQAESLNGALGGALNGVLAEPLAFDHSNAAGDGEEINLQESFGLTPAELADCVMNAHHVAAPQEPEQVESLLKQIKQLWDEQFKPEALKSWFRRSIPAFRGKTPFDMVKDGKAEAVLNLLGRFKEGIYS